MTTNNSLHEYMVGRFAFTPSIHVQDFFRGAETKSFNSNIKFTLGEVEKRDSVHYWKLLVLCNDTVSAAEIIQNERGEETEL